MIDPGARGTRRHGAREQPSRLVRGIAAGIVGTAALTLSDRIERRLLGAVPIYSDHRIGLRLARRLSANASVSTGARLGSALRWVYGPMLGAAYAAVRPALPRRRTAAAALLSGGIALAELTVFPRIGATPPLRRWPLRQRAMLLVHTSVYALVAALVYADEPTPR